MKSCNLVIFLFLIITTFSCKNEKDPAAEKARLLTANQWLLVRLTDAQGKDIDPSKLDIQTKILFDLQFEFRSNNTVRAADKKTGYIINGGTWYLVEKETAIDVDIVQLKDRFGLVELSRTKMILAKKILVSGAEMQAKMEFVPKL